MERICKVCNHTIEGSKCEYCGYFNVVALDQSAALKDEERASKHRADLLSNITFSIEAKEYKWNETSMKLDVIGTMDFKIADGLSCYKKIAWADRPFGQSLEDKPQQSEKDLKIFYTVKDQKRCETLKITPVQCNDFWKIGVRINEDFTFIVVLGTADNYATSSSAQLILR